MATGRPGHRSPKRPSGSRRRYLWALTGVPVVAAAGVLVAMGPHGAATQTRDQISAAGPSRAVTAQGPATDVQAAAQSPCAAGGGTVMGSGRSAACSVGAEGIARMPGHRSRPHPRPSASSPSASAPPSAPATAAPSSSAPAATAPASAGSSQQGTPADQVLALINQARAQNGLPALTYSSGLDDSASQHNLLMAQGCGLSHQCAGEPAIGDRETAAGVHWTSAGENIGEEGPISDDTTDIAQAAVALTQDMLNEQPPNDGHRKNILSSSFGHIGIAVYRASSGTVWMTQDFSN